TSCSFHFFSSTHPPTTAIYPLPLHDALPIFVEVLEGHVLRGRERLRRDRIGRRRRRGCPAANDLLGRGDVRAVGRPAFHLELPRSEEHTSELQSRENLVCRLLLEKKKIR